MVNHFSKSLIDPTLVCRDLLLWSGAGPAHGMAKRPANGFIPCRTLGLPPFSPNFTFTLQIDRSNFFYESACTIPELVGGAGVSEVLHKPEARSYAIFYANAMPKM